MSYKKCFSFLLPLFAMLFFGAHDEAHACSCMPPQTVLEAYEAAGFVVVTRVISVEKSEKAAPEGQMSDGENYVDGVKSTRIVVERVYKGSLKVGDEITFGQGGGADCIWTFSEEDIGRQYLFYLRPREKNPDIWYAGTCTRSGGLDHVAEDLLYLNKLDKVRGKSRLSGTLEYNGFAGGAGWSVEGRKIRITGAGKTHEIKTGKNGAYEIYDLPAGQYLVEVETPAGWKVDPYYLGLSQNYAGDRESDAPKKIPVILEAKKHAALYIRFEIDNAIRGKLYSPAGKPMKDVCIRALLAQNSKSGYHADCTDESGAFTIAEVPPGSYILAVNVEGKISSDEPFKTFYYPNVLEREKATVINIGAGDHLTGFNIYAPQAEETITIEGRFLYSDGKPVVGESVEFKAATTKENVEGDARAQTDANGRFSIKILKGLKGELTGEMYTYVGEFANCPKLERVIKETGGTSAEIKTPGVEIQAESDLQQVELKYPFPGCRKAKSSEEK